MLTWQSCLFACCARNYVKKIWFIHTYVQVPPSSGFHGKQVPQSTFPWRIMSDPPLLSPPFLEDSLSSTQLKNIALEMSLYLFIYLHLLTAHKKFRNHIKHMKGKFQIPGNMRNTIQALHFLLHHEEIHHKDSRSLFFTETGTSI